MHHRWTRRRTFVNTKKIVDVEHIGNIHFLGYVNENEKAELYALSDVFIHPSKSEGFSISILEALAYGLPVLITEACNFPQVAEYHAGIVITDKYVVIRIKDALQKLWHKKNLLKVMGKNARKLVEEKFSITGMAKKINDIYAKQAKIQAE